MRVCGQMVVDLRKFGYAHTHARAQTRTTLIPRLTNNWMYHLIILNDLQVRACMSVYVYEREGEGERENEYALVK